jgi:hypothetical protein
MNLAAAFVEINWLSVIVATLAAFAIGGLWYSPLFVGKAWQSELKLSDADIKAANMPMIFGLTFVLNFISAIVLDMFIGRAGTLKDGLFAGLLVGVAWIATSLGTNYLFARKSFKLFLIDATYFIIYFAVMGLILGAW